MSKTFDKTNSDEKAIAILESTAIESSSLFMTYPEVLNIQQVSELLALSPNTVRAMIYQKQLPAKKLGGKWRVLRTDVAQLFSALQDSS